jgi:MurNAc alpha-1-phosphate uridylyltransferase
MSMANINQAMVLAAGLGLRLRPITDTRPKPLVVVAGQTILDRVLDALAAADVDRAVVNTHYLGAMIEDHVSGRTKPRLELSPETALLETGGGIASALAHFGADPFYAINADIAWDEGADGMALHKLAHAFQSTDMDVVLLVVPRAHAVGYSGAGDFYIDPDGHLERRGNHESAPYVFTGLQILNPALFDGCPDGAFSLNVLYDRAIAQGRLSGVIHTGRWFHIGDARGLELAEAGLAEHAP